MPPGTFLHNKKKKWRQRQKRKGFKAETIKRMSPRSKYCFSHSRESIIPKFFFSANHGDWQYFSVLHGLPLWNSFRWPCTMHKIRCSNEFINELLFLKVKCLWIYLLYKHHLMEHKWNMVPLSSFFFSVSYINYSYFWNYQLFPLQPIPPYFSVWVFWT